jgi:EAL domain-containing protein (putative c-di-GMP-specific phosphodiesterase class I)
MYAAKQAGKGRWRSFRPSMRSRAASSLGIREHLEHGFSTDAVEVHYQPVVATATGRICGIEALARWRHPKLGLLRPGDFLAVAEEMGLAAVLDWCVLERVALDRARWRTEAPALAALPLSVNITVAEVGPELEKRIDAFLSSPGGRGTQLWLELTERAMILNADAVAPTLERLRARGVGLALDDFGVGYSSLAHLHRLPIGLVKLDRAFLASVATAGPDFMAAVVDLCTGLDLQVVAEGRDLSSTSGVLGGHRLTQGSSTQAAGRAGPAARRGSAHHLAGGVGRARCRPRARVRAPELRAPSVEPSLDHRPGPTGDPAVVVAQPRGGGAQGAGQPGQGEGVLGQGVAVASEQDSRFLVRSRARGRRAGPRRRPADGPDALEAVQAVSAAASGRRGAGGTGR